LLERLLPGRRRKPFAAWQIELTTRCQLECSMCIRHGRDWRNGDMRLDDFAKLAPYLRQVETVVLQGWGEPLLHRNLVDAVRLAKGGGGSGPPGTPPSVGFVTSGKGMDRAYAAELVDAGLDFLGFSLAGATAETHGAIRVHSDFGEVVDAAEHVRALRRERGLERPRTHVAFLMMKQNIHEVPDLPELARRMGVEAVVLTSLVDVVDEWQDGQRVFGCDGAEEHEEVLREAERRARERKVALTRPALSPTLTPVCAEDPLRNLFVGFQGDVSPCVYLGPPVASDTFPRRFCGREVEARRICFGNLFREPLEAIWARPEYVAFRERFARRARRHRLLSAVGAASRPGGGVSRAELPEPPEPCRTCHKMLGV
ncbi:MAG TPA: radical SAM/SPASM domain-containing protein, partial [Anaeromyxobacteraceae bacterium]|nr:radical SAM/SPASM domain-containing protein [Anaeromyxobacteraceae bacterium]